MPNPKYAAYKPADPYFNLVRGAGDLVDGEHFFDILAGDVVYEVLYKSRLASRYSGRETDGWVQGIRREYRASISR